MSRGKGLKRLTVLNTTYAEAVELADIQNQIWRMVSPGSTTTCDAELAIHDALEAGRNRLAQYQQMARRGLLPVGKEASA